MVSRPLETISKRGYDHVDSCEEVQDESDSLLNHS